MFEKMSSNLVALLYSSLNVQGLDRSKERALVSNGLCKSAQHQATKTMNGARAIARRAYPRRSRCAPRVPRPPPTHSDVAAVCPIGLPAKKADVLVDVMDHGSYRILSDVTLTISLFSIESKTVENIPVCPAPPTTQHARTADHTPEHGKAGREVPARGGFLGLQGTTRTWCRPPGSE